MWKGDIMAAPAAEKWRLQGDWFDSCNCTIPCPCTFAQPPTYGDCDGVLLWHIRQGSYGDIALDGLNVAMLGYFAGNPWTGEAHDARAAFFFDERADQEQRQALQMIFGGQAGGWPATFAGLLPGLEVTGMDFAPIHASFDENLASWSVEIPGRASATVEALSGPTTPAGARVQLHNPPGAEVGPGQVATWGRATSDHADAYGFQWDRSGNSSKYFPFDWSGPEEA
jgi:hypothetical protein